MFLLLTVRVINVFIVIVRVINICVVIVRVRNQLKCTGHLLEFRREERVGLRICRLTMFCDRCIITLCNEQCIIIMFCDGYSNFWYFNI